MIRSDYLNAKGKKHLARLCSMELSDIYENADPGSREKILEKILSLLNDLISDKSIDIGYTGNDVSAVIAGCLKPEDYKLRLLS